MGKQRAKSAAHSDTEQIVSAKGLAHFTHPNERHSSTSRSIINRYEQATKKGREEIQQGCGDNRSRREKMSASHRRSKSLTSMGRRKTDKKNSSSGRSAKSTLEDRENTIHRMQRSTSVEKSDSFQPSLKPILKRDSELPTARTVRDLGSQEVAKAARKVSLITTDFEANVWIRQDQTANLPTSAKSRSTRSTPELKIDSAEVRELAERMASKRVAHYQQTGIPQIGNDIQKSSSEPVSTHSVQVHQHANGKNGDMLTHLHTGNNHDESLANKREAQRRQPQAAAHSLSVADTTLQTSHSNYREIWIGRLPDPPTDKNTDLLGLSLTSFTSQDQNSDSIDSSNHSDVTWSGAKTATDLIDLSVELPCQLTADHCITSADVKEESLLMDALPLISLGGESDVLSNGSTMDCSVLSKEEDDLLISKLLDKLHTSSDSVFSSNEDLKKPNDCTEVSENRSSVDIAFGDRDFGRSKKTADTMNGELQIQREKGGLIEHDQVSISGSEHISHNLLQEEREDHKPLEVLSLADITCLQNDVTQNTCSLTEDKTSLNADRTCTNYGALVVPPPCIFSNETKWAKRSAASAMTNEAALSIISTECANSSSDALAKDCVNNNLIAISTVDDELSGIHTANSTSSSALSVSAHTLASVGRQQSHFYCDVSDSSSEKIVESETESLSSSPSAAEQTETDWSKEDARSENFTRVKKRAGAANGAAVGRRRHTVNTNYLSKTPALNPVEKVATPKILESCAPLRKSFSSAAVIDDLKEVTTSEQPIDVPPTDISLSSPRDSRVDYDSLPRLALPQRAQKPRSKSLELIIDQNPSAVLTTNSVDSRLIKTQSLSRGFSLNGPIVKGSSSQRGSIAERLAFPSKISRMFSKKKKMDKRSSKDSVSSATEVVTVDSLYSDWLTEKTLQERKRGEGVRTVVLARTKKGYGFVLRGAKAEQLRKLNVQFVPSEKMPALQYLDSVEKGSVSDKAGLRAGDFILEIDGVNVVQASHEQTVQIIKKAGDVLAMKVVRAVLTQENGGTHLVNGAMNGSATLPHRKPQKEESQQGSSSAVLVRKSNSETPNGISPDDEKQAIDAYNHDQLDAALANYDSDSRSSGSGANPTTSVTFREPKTASIRQRPSSSHFNSIQELDDMFAAPAAPAQTSAPAATDKADARKPAKSRVKKFWSKGKSSNKLNGNNKPMSLSQPNLAALDRDAEVKPITMYEMSLGHSIDVESRAPQADIPRTFSGDLSTLRRKSISGGTVPATTAPVPPPPPMYPAPVAPEEDKIFSSSKTGSLIAQTTLLRNQAAEGKRFLPRTPLPADNIHSINSSHDSSISVDGGTLQRGKTPPPPPQRISSHDSGVILAMQGQSVQTTSEKTTSSFHTFNQSSSSSSPQQSTSQVPSTSPFTEAIRRAAAERETDKSANNNTAETTNDVYAVVQKRHVRIENTDSSNNSASNRPSSSPALGSAVSVEDQLRMAVAKRRTVIERQDTDSDRSHSQTPERALSPTDKENVQTSKSEATNFRELAEQKRQQFLKKKADSSQQLLPPPPADSPNNKLSDSATEENLSELQKVMSRLSVAKPEETNNNIKKKTPPPMVMKKPGKPSSPTSIHDHLSPVEEFPPPPPPHDFGPDASNDIIPPPSFEVSNQYPSQSLSPPPPLSPPSYPVSVKADQTHHHDADNHSVTSSVGSDTISSVSQDGNRLSVATSGYSSDPNRPTKLSFSGSDVFFTGKNVETWTTEEVGEWLDAIGLGEYRAVFADNCIEGETLISMTKSDVKELGVEKVGHRVKLDKEIKKLVSETSA